MGVKPGDTIQLMADLKRMAWNARRAGQRFNPAALLDAFLQATGSNGNVLVSTFNFDLRDGDTFDVRSTPSISGALAQAALQHPAFQRTAHALHSFAVAGADALELVSRQEDGSFGVDSTFALLHQRSGILIAFDMPLNDALTFTHYVEERIGVTYRAHTPVRVHYTGHDGSKGQRSFTTYAKHFGHHMDLAPLEPLLERAGALQRGEVDGSRFIRVDLSRAYEVIAHDIRNNDARSIHTFSWRLWLRDHTKNVLRTFGFRTRQERTAHAARTA